MKVPSDREIGPVERALDLAGLFFSPASDIGLLSVARSEAVPDPFRRLLDHSNHMTSSMESFHGCRVDLRIVNRHTEPAYAREIMLHRTDGSPVQYGIVRMRFDSVDNDLKQQILKGMTPLGTLLIQADVLRHIDDVQILECFPGKRLAGLFCAHENLRTFGRVAQIILHGKPAIELLEIVVPQSIPTSTVVVKDLQS